MVPFEVWGLVSTVVTWGTQQWQVARSAWWGKSMFSGPGRTSHLPRRPLHKWTQWANSGTTGKKHCHLQNVSPGPLDYWRVTASVDALGWAFTRDTGIFSLFPSWEPSTSLFPTLLSHPAQLRHVCPWPRLSVSVHLCSLVMAQPDKVGIPMYCLRFGKIYEVHLGCNSATCLIKFGVWFPARAKNYSY